MAKILIVDDQPMVLKCLKSALMTDGHDVATVAAGDLALKLVGFTSFDIVITDYSMPRMDGLTFLEVALRQSPGMPIIMITGYGTADTALQAMSKGAFDYLTKPFSLDTLRSTVNAAEAYVKAQLDSKNLVNPDASVFAYPNVVAVSPQMIEVCKRIEEAVSNSSPVLLRGEHGTGKELLARTIHACGANRSHLFEKIDCPNLPKDASVSGMLAMIENGSVFFREIGYMPQPMQQELLQMLHAEATHTGNENTVAPLPLRVLASTSITLDQLVLNHQFNGYLMEALQTTVIDVPPLRERPEDIRVHLGLTLRQLEDDAEEVAGIQPDALIILERYPWPGNIPELEETIKNAFTMAKGGAIAINHLPREIVSGAKPAGSTTHSLDVEQFRGRVVKSFLREAGIEWRSAPLSPSQ